MSTNKATPEIKIKKSDGRVVLLEAEKIRRRFFQLSFGLDKKSMDIDSLVESVVRGTYNDMTTEIVDTLIAQTAAYAVVRHPDYGLLGGRLAVSALHKRTNDSVFETFQTLHKNVCLATQKKAPLILDRVWKIVEEKHELLQSIIDYKRDYTFEFFGFKTLERSYLLRIEKERGKMTIVERPQHMWLRVALGIHFEDMDRVKETYNHLSLGFYTHATPTLFNAGTPSCQMSSCFLVAMKEDSIEGIYDTLKECAVISKAAGGIGFWCHNIRCQGSYIAGTNGTSNGLVPMLRVWNNTARYVDQGGGKRKGAFAAYLEPWHGDIFDVIQLRRNTGAEENRARDLFYGLWIPDLFMRRVEKGAHWTLFDPHSAPGLWECYGDEFDKLYQHYEKKGLGIRTIQAQELWFAIMEAQMETGIPYLLYKDACNKKSNQKHLGTIKCSNLCTEIVEYSDANETAVCNLCSVALPKFLSEKKDEKTGMMVKFYDHEKLRQVIHNLVLNLNRVIDNNFYPVKETARSNFRHRPVGIGVQGLADTFIQLRLPFACEEAKILNRNIFETIYYAACEASMEIAITDGPYETFKGSPSSYGKLQFDLWDEKKQQSGFWDWDSLKKKIMEHGMRNSLLIAPMPTASTSQILGNTECFEPITSNIYIRRVLSGEFPVVNKYLVVDLIKAGLWNEGLRNQIIAHNGSIQYISVIPADLRELYKTAWELRMKDIIDMAADRAQYIDQSQSMNVFLQSPTTSQLTSMHFYSWKKGLKTGSYYLRTCPAVEAIKFTVDMTQLRETERHQKELQEKETLTNKDKNVLPSKSTAPMNGKLNRTPNMPEECLNCGS